MVKKGKRGGGRDGEHGLSAAASRSKAEQDDGLAHYCAPPHWPQDVFFLASHSQPSRLLPRAHHLTFCVAPRSTHAAHPCQVRARGWTVVRPITSSTPFHPAYGSTLDTHPALAQHGLFARIDIPPRTLVVPYLGMVHLAGHHEGDEDAHSRYDASIEADDGTRLGIDATRMGSEARCTCVHRSLQSMADADALFSLYIQSSTITVASCPDQISFSTIGPLHFHAIKSVRRLTCRSPCTYAAWPSTRAPIRSALAQSCASATARDGGLRDSRPIRRACKGIASSSHIPEYIYVCRCTLCSNFLGSCLLTAFNLDLCQSCDNTMSSQSATFLHIRHPALLCRIEYSSAGHTPTSTLRVGQSIESRLRSATQSRSAQHAYRTFRLLC